MYMYVVRYDVRIVRTSLVPVIRMHYEFTTILQRATKLVLQALYMLRQIRPSVRLSVRPSVTLRYCAKTREHIGMRSSPSGS